LSQAQWQQDIDKLSSKITLLHPNPWRTMSEQQFLQQLHEIVQTSPSQSRQQTIAQLIGAVSMLTKAGSDGQTGIWPLQQGSDFHILPLCLYWFTDGVYIVATDADNKELEGLKLTAIAGIPIEQLIDKVQPFVSHENAMGLKSWTPLYALIPELLESLKLSQGLAVAITTENIAGKSSTKQLNAISSSAYEDTFPQALNNAVLPVSLTAPLYLQRVFEQQFWFQRLNENTLYLQYNQIVDEDEKGQSFSDFMRLVEIEIKKYQLTSLILDVRNNASRETDSYAPFFEMLNNFKDNQRAVALYVLIGRSTLSAAVNFITDLNNKSNAIFVGEPTGGSPDQFSIPQAIVLPNSNLTVRIATQFSKKMANKNNILTYQPDFLIELSAKDYFSKKDQALKKILDLIELKSFE